MELSWAEIKLAHMAVDVVLYVATTDALYVAQAKSSLCVVNVDNGKMHQIQTTPFK